MQNELKSYNNWLNYPLEDGDLLEELKKIEGNSDAIYDRFYRDLSFGTAGLRGVIGAGTNRMNIYTVRRATQGLSKMLLEKKATASVCISYDSRIKSDLFAKTAAAVLASNGIKVYITDRLMPTPILSFCVRFYNCDAGIMITASHNPAAYNGYKAYGADGCQMNEGDCAQVLKFASETDIFGANCSLSFEDGLKNGLIEYVKNEVYEDYYKKVVDLSIEGEAIEKAGLNVVYTPLNGTGNEPVLEILNRKGLKNISVVPEQQMPDGNFTTCTYPNPEIKEALKLGLSLCEQRKADLLIATDPDADRVGIAVRKENGELSLMTGNMVGVLLLNYIAERKSQCGNMPKNAVAVKSIVSTELASRVAESYNIEMRDVLTGFKYIGEQIGILEKSGEADRFILGFEESYGYLSGSFVRDKDAVIASMLICEMASYYKLMGKTLLTVYKEIEEKHGVYHHAVDNFAFEGATGLEKMQSIMNNLRTNPPYEICSLKTLAVSDYKASVVTNIESGEQKKINLPSADVLKFALEGGCQLIVRPSGTEPKIKFYYTVVSDNKQKAEDLCKGFSAAAKQMIK